MADNVCQSAKVSLTRDVDLMHNRESHYRHDMVLQCPSRVGSRRIEVAKKQNKEAE